MPLPVEGTDQSQTKSYDICDLECDFKSGSSKSILDFLSQYQSTKVTK